MRSRVLGATATLSLSACLTIPDFKGTGGGSDGMSVTADADGPTVNGPGYSLHFSSQGFQFPDRWVVGSDQILAHGNPVACGDEDLMGLALFPSPRVNAASTAVPGANTKVIADGLAVAKLALDWHGQLSCAAPVDITGRTTFTLMPDGRIVRHDVVESPQATADAASCTCGPAAGSQWFVTSYVTLDGGFFDQIVDHTLDPITPSDTARQDQIMCTTGPAHTIAAAWSGPTTRVVQPVPNATALVYDFLDPKPATIGPATAFAPATAAYLIGGGAQCAGLVDTLIGFQSEALLSVNGSHLGTATDGIYGGEDDGGHAGLPADATTTLAAVTKPVPAGFVVWLDFGVARSSFSITNPAESGTDWFIIGRPTDPNTHDRQLMIWFRHELPVGQTITIVAGND